MNILVLNSGSSSVKLAVIDPRQKKPLFRAHAERINSDNPELSFSDGSQTLYPEESGHDAVIRMLLEAVKGKTKVPIKGVGHRVAHGGKHFTRPELIDEEIIKKIESLSALAPLHNPPNLSGIRQAQEIFPELPHVAVFDTAFHRTLPRRAKYYGLPKRFTEKYEIERYGFHGTSHAFVAHRAAEHLRARLRELRIISCHLGNGCSVAAIEYARSLDTSMGWTPLEGLLMGTRVGDVDVGIILEIMEREGMSVAEMKQVLNKESGLLGLSDASHDMRDLEKQAADGHDGARLAIHAFTHRLRKYIGAYAALMGGADAIVFTGGIGENSPMIRHGATQRLDYMGAVLDYEFNQSAAVSHEEPVAEISSGFARCKILVVATDEQQEIAHQANNLITERYRVNTTPQIPIAVSARHVHLRQETVEALFGEGYQLTKYRDLSQPGQYACKELVTLIGPKNRIERVRILGPTRDKDQVEISRTDEYLLGIDAPVRASGHTENSPGIILEGTEGRRVELKEGVICAWRHIHMEPENAEIFGVKDRDVVQVEVQNRERSLIFGDVLVRVSPDYRLEMHIDTDEGNAAELTSGDIGALVPTSETAVMTRRKMS